MELPILKKPTPMFSGLKEKNCGNVYSDWANGYKEQQKKEASSPPTPKGVGLDFAVSVRYCPKGRPASVSKAGKLEDV